MKNIVHHLRAYSGNEDFYFIGTDDELSDFLEKQNLYDEQEKYIATHYPFFIDGSMVGLLPFNLVMNDSEIAKVFRELYLSTNTKVWKVEKVKE